MYTVGLGDPNAASVVRIGGEALQYQGAEVRSRLEEAPLREIAETTRGTYIPAQTRTLPLGQVYLDATAGQALRQEDDDRLPVYQQHYTLVPGGGVRAAGAGRGDRRPSATPVLSRRFPPPPTFIAPARTP